MSGIIIKPRARIFHGHEWVYGAEVQKMFGDPQPGDVITLKDYKDRGLGSAIFNPKSQIVARRFSRHREDRTEDFFVRRLRRALAWRSEIPDFDVTLCRMVWSESDGLPGVILDRYGDHFVLQTLTQLLAQQKNGRRRPPRLQGNPPPGPQYVFPRDIGAPPAVSEALLIKGVFRDLK